MELEELLQAEGIAAEDLEDTLAWARGRAEELVSGLSADVELGPLLSGEGTGETRAVRQASPEAAGRESMSPEPMSPEPMGAAPVRRDPEGTQPSAHVPAPPPDSAAGLADRLAAETAVEDDLGAPSSETDAALAELPPPPERPDLPEVGPGVEAGPMADAAYDQGSVASELPQPPQEEPLPGVPDRSSADADAGDPAELQRPAAASAPVDGPDDITQPRELMPEGNDGAPGVTHSGSIEIDDDEIELLDDDDLELVDDEHSEPEPPPTGGNGHREDVPEWQAALTSAQLGGGAKADQESGLYRLQGTTVEKVGAQPDGGAAPSPGPAVDEPVDNDESMDVDLGDI